MNRVEYRSSLDAVSERALRSVNRLAEIERVTQAQVPIDGLLGLRGGDSETWRLRPLSKVEHGTEFSTVCLSSGAPLDLHRLKLWLQFLGSRKTHEVLRIKGCLLIQQSKTEEAENALRAAIDFAREQQAKSWELRATTTLARHLAERGERRPARELLAPVYQWFTEGFDTKDLQDARSLLDELEN